MTIPPPPPLVRSIRVVADPGAIVARIVAIAELLGLTPARRTTDAHGRQVFTWDRW